MENPGSYKNDSDEPPTGGKKFPSKWWYWINGQDTSEYTNEDFKYPNWFKQKEYGWMLNKKLIYTAVSRAKKSLIILGDEDAFMIKSNEEDNKIRHTTLTDCIKKRF